MPQFEVTVWDLVILAGYVIGARILFGWYLASRATQGSENYFLGGRNLRWPIVSLSFYVANMSGGSFVGLPGSGPCFGSLARDYCRHLGDLASTTGVRTSSSYNGRSLPNRPIMDAGGSLLAGLLKLPNLLFILILPGVMATALYPDLVFPALVFDLLPMGLRGLLLAALVAAILSSLEAILNSSATLLTMDFVRSLKPQTSDRTLTKWGRAATLGFMLFAALWTPMITGFSTLWQYLQSFMSYIAPPVTVIFLIGIFWPRANEQGVFVTLVVGAPSLHHRVKWKGMSGSQVYGTVNPKNLEISRGTPTIATCPSH